jgi:hypothetical protein
MATETVTIEIVTVTMTMTPTQKQKPEQKPELQGGCVRIIIINSTRAAAQVKGLQLDQSKDGGCETQAEVHRGKENVVPRPVLRC